MKISKLIEQLQELQEKLGDVPVLVEERGRGGHAEHEIGQAASSSMSPSLLADGYFERGSPPSLETIKEFYPLWDKELNNEDVIDIFERENTETEYVLITLGRMLYAT